MSVRDHLQSPRPASRIRASPWIAREDGNIPVAQATLAMKLCPHGGNGQRHPPAPRAGTSALSPRLDRLDRDELDRQVYQRVRPVRDLADELDGVAGFQQVAR